MATHHWWRVYISELHNNFFWCGVSCAELELRETIGGSDLTVPGGPITANNTDGSFPPANAIDNDPATFAGSPGGYGNVPWGTPPWWLKYYLDPPRNIVEIFYRVRNANESGCTPKTLTIQYSDDDVAWTDARVHDCAAWAAGDGRALLADEPDPPPPPAWTPSPVQTLIVPRGVRNQRTRRVLGA
jgi:hypothetical protein